MAFTAGDSRRSNMKYSRALLFARQNSAIQELFFLSLVDLELDLFHGQKNVRNCIFVNVRDAIFFILYI
jgi:hypothetical protein